MNWSKEDSLILSILNSSLSKAKDQRDEDRIDLMGIDTDRFIDLARVEGLSALLFRILKENGLINIFPSHLQKSLEESYLITLTNNMVLINDLSRILNSLEDKGIRTIVLKGAALLDRVYSDIGVRPVMDIDLLFYRGENERAGKVFEDLGYRLVSFCPRIYDNGRAVLDIHTEVDSFTRIGHVSNTPKISHDSLWEDAPPWEEGFKFVRILSPEDTILTLSIHLLKHSFLRFIWHIDIIKLIEKNPELDWEKIGKKAREAGFERLLYYVLSYLKENFGMIPEGFLSEIKPKRSGWIERGIMNRIIKNQRKEGYGDILYLFTIPGLLKKVLFVRDILFPSREKMVEISRVKYPYLYYPRRIFGLLVMMGNLLWGYTGGNRRSSVASLDGERL